MATGVLISSFVYAGVPVLSATFGFFKTSAGTQIQRLQITGQVAPAGGNITIQLVDGSGTAYAGATVTLPSASGYYDQPLAAPITLGLGKVVRAQITGVDNGTASDIVVNLIGATAQGSNAPSGCCGPQECQPPTAQLLFFQGNIQPQVDAAQASANAAALSAAQAETAETGAETAKTAAEAAEAAAQVAQTNAEAQVGLAAGYATNANNAATASSVYAGQSQASATAAAASAVAAAASAVEAQAGLPAAVVRLTAASTQTIPDATPTTVSWDGIQFDDLVFWSGINPTRLTIPAGVSRVRLSAGIRWTANSTGERKLKIRSNPAGPYEADSIWASDDRPSDASGDATLGTPVIDVEEGMYFELLVEQNSGGGLDIDTSTAAGNRANFFCVEVVKRS